MPTHKSFVMTIANPHPSDMDGLRKLEPICSTLFVSLEHETHYHLQCYWTVKKEAGNKSFKFFREFFPKKKLISYESTDKDVDISMKDTAWIKSASSTRGYNYDYIIRGLNPDGTPKTFSCVIYNKNNSEKIHNDPSLVRVVKRMREGEHMDDIIIQDEFVEASSKALFYLKHVQGTITAKRYKTTHRSIEDFNIETPRETAHLFTIMHGTTGIGKTQFAKAHFKNPLLVRSFEGVKKFRFNVHDGIIFDDMDFSEWKRERIIHLTDWEEGAELWCRHSNWYRPPQTQMIATTNNPGGNIFGEYFYDPAIQRRIQVYNLGDQPLFSKDEQDGEYDQVMD